MQLSEHHWSSDGVVQVPSEMSSLNFGVSLLINGVRISLAPHGIEDDDPVFNAGIRYLLTWNLIIRVPCPKEKEYS